MTMEPVTINEIAEVLGAHRTSAQRRANKEQWPYQETDVRGGKEKRYPVAQLPKSIQIALAAKRAAGDLLPVASSPIPTTSDDALDAQPTPPSMTQRMEEKMQHKAALLGLYNRALAAAGWGNKVQARSSSSRPTTPALPGRIFMNNSAR